MPHKGAMNQLNVSLQHSITTLAAHGWSHRRIARELDIHRETVGHVILTAYSWAFDKFEQGINRAHRLNSPWPVNVWSVICDGSIDRKLEAGIHEKKDAAELVLDGHLLGETPTEVNLNELLRIAQSEFKLVKTIDEDELERDWPRLRAALGRAFSNWNNVCVSEIIMPDKSPNFNSKSLPLWRQRFIRR